MFMETTITSSVKATKSVQTLRRLTTLLKNVCVFDDYPKLVWRLLLLFKWHKYFKMHGQQCKLDYGILNRILWYCTRNVAEFVYNIVTVMAEHDQVEHKMTGK